MSINRLKNTGLKTPVKYTSLIICFTILAASCSRKKDTFLSRNFHAVTAEFNALYNGYNAFEQGRETLNRSYFDDYWDILPVERMEITDDVILPGESKNENFTIAEEKAIKAIQKHGMMIDGKERNPQIDEAYLLLGKSRYFDQRFIPALEAFNHILYKYPTSDKINQAKIWREKTNIRLENEELAIKNLKRLLKYETLKDQDLADATSMLAQAYLNQKIVDTAITQLEIAAQATKSNSERGRYRYIQGQLYNKLGYKDSANIAFDKVIALNRKTPRIYMISAQMEKVKNFDYENGNQQDLLELLSKLKENRENRPFLDKIYHQIGQYYRKIGSDSLAMDYFDQSLKTKLRDKKLKVKNYEIIGDMYFDQSIYAMAGEYYDSTMMNLKLDSKPYRLIKRKRDNLKDVVYYESIAKVNDSLLNLVSLSEAERRSYFESFVEELKNKAEEAEKKAKAAEALKLNNGGLATTNNTTANPANIGAQISSTAGFYFYSPTTTAYGKNQFTKIWGDRPLEDNWRWSSTGISSTTTSTSTGVDIITSASKDELFDPNFYISKIPSEEKEIDSIAKERNYAYYQLGLIYKEKFKEYELAKNKFQNLLKSNPEEKLILPSKYNLYKIYELLGENDEAAIAKTDIIKNFPESRYAIILANPELASNIDENSAESLYEALYKQHENQDYKTVISKSETYIIQFDGEPIVPKFELLRATAIGRLQGYESYKKAIEAIVTNYPDTDEGKQAKNIATSVLPNIANSDFIEDENAVMGNYKVIYQFTKSKAEEILEFKTVLDEALRSVSYYNLKTSVDVYDQNTTLVVIHGFKNPQVARTFDQLLNEENKVQITAPYFAISSQNYRIIQIHKNLFLYLNINNK